jgi:hypothetical protein
MLGLVILLFTQAAHAQTAAHAWRDHLTRQDVITALGEPNSDGAVGNNELLMYKGGLVIQIQNGEVSDISGAVPQALKPVAVVAAPASSAATTAPAAADSSVNLAAQPASPAPAPVSASAPASPPAAANATSAAPASSDDQNSEKLIGDLSSPSIIPQGTTMSGVLAKALGPGQGGEEAGTSPGSPAIPSGLEKLVGGGSDDGSPWSRPDNLEGFLAGLVLKTVVMTLVLKGVFAYKDFPLIWMDAVLVAAGTSLCNEILAWLFTLNDFGKIAAMVQADQLVAGAVLLGLITTCTEAKSFPTAAGIMVVAITVNTALQFAQMFI